MRRPLGNQQHTRNDDNDVCETFLSKTYLPLSLALIWSFSSKLSFAERNQMNLGMAFHLLCCVPLFKLTDFWTLPQTQPESDPSDGWDDPVDKIHSYVTRGNFFFNSN